MRGKKISGKYKDDNGNPIRYVEWIKLHPKYKKKIEVQKIESEEVKSLRLCDESNYNYPCYTSNKDTEESQDSENEEQSEPARLEQPKPIKRTFIPI